MARPPLDGIRIADFTWVWAGPYCNLQLAHLGADVIRIETRTRPCVTRLLPPWPDMKPGGVNRSGYFNQYSQGKRSLTLNFKDPAAHEVARRLIATSDVVINNFAHGVMDKDGFRATTPCARSSPTSSPSSSSPATATPAPTRTTSPTVPRRSRSPASPP